MTPASTSSSSAPLVLALDTSTRLASVAIARGAEVLAELSVRGELGRAQHLVPEIDGLLRRVGVGIGDVGALAATLGPGSFTGIRVGLATLRGLGVARGIPAVGLSTLEALALRIPFAAVPVVTLLDPRRERVYAATWDTRSGAPTLLEPERHIALDEALQPGHGPRIYTGEGALLLGEMLRQRLGGDAILAPAPLCEGLASTVAGWAWVALAEPEGASRHPLTPRYLQASAADQPSGRGLTPPRSPV